MRTLQDSSYQNIRGEIDNFVSISVSLFELYKAFQLPVFPLNFSLFFFAEIYILYIRQFCQQMLIDFCNKQQIILINHENWKIVDSVNFCSILL